MTESAVYRPHHEAPARATLFAQKPRGAWKSLHAQRFEVISRGDFVPGILYLADAAEKTPAPLLLLQHGAAEGMHSDRLSFAAAWARGGLAIATIDLPLHGERSSPKLSERLVTGIQQLDQGTRLDAETYALVEEFARQTTSDLIRTIDALSDLSSVDASRIAFMGFGIGAVAGSYLLAHDPRLRAAILAGAGGGLGPTDLDPTTYLPGVSGPAILVLSGDDDDPVVSRASAALFESAPEPKEALVFPGNSRDRTRPVPEETLAQLWRFLSKRLGL